MSPGKPGIWFCVHGEGLYSAFKWTHQSGKGYDKKLSLNPLFNFLGYFLLDIVSI